jgi:hypothetical protein
MLLFVPLALLIISVEIFGFPFLVPPVPVFALFLPVVPVPVPVPVPAFRLLPVPVSPVMFGELLFPPAGEGESVIVCVKVGLTVLFGVTEAVQAPSSADSRKTMRMHANIRFIFLPPDEYCCYTIIYPSERINQEYF